MPDSKSELNPQPIPPGLGDPRTTIGQLRQHFGPTFAQGHDAEQSLGHLLTASGASSLEEYVVRGGTSSSQPKWDIKAQKSA